MNKIEFEKIKKQISRRNFDVGYVAGAAAGILVALAISLILLYWQ